MMITKHFEVRIKGSWEVKYKDPVRLKRQSTLAENDTNTPSKGICVDPKDFREVHGKKNQQALVVDLSEKTELPCHFCGTVAKETHQSMLWYRYKKQRSTNENGGDETIWTIQEVKLDLRDDERLNRVYTTVDHNLIIKDFQPRDVGTYFCVPYQKGIDAISHYSFKSDLIDSTSATSMSLAWKQLTNHKANIKFLLHLDIELPMKAKLVSNEGYNYPRPVKPLVSKKNNWMAFTKWEEWGPCSVCDLPGERRRRGHCMVRLISMDNKTKPEFLDHVLRFFPDGAPCHSSLFFNFVDIVKRGHETEIQSCKVVCPKSELNVPDMMELGPVEFNRSHISHGEHIIGVPTYSLKPPLGVNLVLKCPLPDTNITEYFYLSPEDQTKPVSWKNGSDYIVDLELESAKVDPERQVIMPRFSINQEYDLNITETSKYDGQTFSCWKGQTEIYRYKVSFNIIEVEVTEDPWPYYRYLRYSYAVDFGVFWIIWLMRCRTTVGQVERTDEESQLLDPELEESESIIDVIDEESEEIPEYGEYAQYGMFLK